MGGVLGVLEVDFLKEWEDLLVKLCNSAST